MSTQTLITITAFLTGLVLGSFLNVVIARLPKRQSIVSPPSRCPRCKAAIRPWDNVPMLSYMMLGGRCRNCRARISWRYPLVELTSGLLLAALVQRAEHPSLLVPHAVFLLTLLAVTWIDLEASLFGPPGLGAALLGALVGGASLWAVGYAYERATGVPGMGGGDVKLAAMMGAFLGMGGVFSAIFLASLFGSLFGVVLIARGKGSRRTAIPFGTFLAPAAMALLLYGDSIYGWYRSLVP
jgi:leader peptidase (prepilin peptidase)/N-methyltransferase